MTTVVRFRIAGGEYAVPVEQAREVRPAAELVPLATSREGVAGLLPWSGGALSVASVLGAGGLHVLVLDSAAGPFGLLADEVTGVASLDRDGGGGAPSGQELALVSGTVRTPDGHLVQLVDVAALGGWLRR
ncbi:MAG TPA: CheW domain-containing protein [Candidatus Dormibacteraeota bacterium]|jgi:chemotaxis signal transduction protein|nr:CheW domain-containing protein [Candidatus Dormibacteraeota bacterium]